MDYKIVQLAQSKDIVITQDYGLASLLLNKVKTVLHHKGYIYNSTNIDMLIQQRYNHAQLRKQGGRHKGPTLFLTKISNTLNIYFDVYSLKYRRHLSS